MEFCATPLHPLERLSAQGPRGLPRLVVLEDEVALVLTLQGLQQLQAVLRATRPNPKLFIRQVSMDSPHSEALHEEIRQRAHEIYEERGREPGNAEQDWLRAETEVLARHRVHQVPDAA